MNGTNRTKDTRTKIWKYHGTIQILNSKHYPSLVRNLL